MFVLLEKDVIISFGMSRAVLLLSYEVKTEI